MIKKSYVPFYQSLIFFSPHCCFFRVKKTLVFRFFSINSQVILKNSWPLASNFSILLSNLFKNSTMIKKSYVPFYQSLIFLFLLAVVASVSKNTCISIFFNKFSSNIEKFSAVGLEFFNITFEFIEKNLNTRVLRHGNNNS